jgi:hypothetical protein
MRNVLFEQVDIVRARDGIDLMHWDGAGEWSNITVRDLRVERCERRSITATVREGGSIRNVRFERIAFADARPGFLRGQGASNGIEGVVFTGLVMGGRPVTSLEAAGIAPNRFVSRVEFETP